jgi:hypothetical protein
MLQRDVFIIYDHEFIGPIGHYVEGKVPLLN